MLTRAEKAKLLDKIEAYVKALEYRKSGGAPSTQYDAEAQAKAEFYRFIKEEL
jgi:hypothetical protein